MGVNSTKRSLVVRFGLLVALVSLATGIAQAGEKYALLIGVRDYDKNELRNLPYPEEDVEALATLFRDAGYRPENIVVMTQTRGGKQGRFVPTAKNVRSELQLLLHNRDEGDSVIVVLAGHGVQFRGEQATYFCPSDACLTAKETLIPLEDVYAELSKSKAGFRLLLVDACRNDPQSDNSRSRPEVDLSSVTRPQVVEPPGGVAAFFSCSPGERAFEHKALKHGVFFHFIIQGLRGEADLDRDREVTLPELQQFASKRVPDFVRAEYGIVQTPDLRGSTRGVVPIVTLDRVRQKSLTERAVRISGQSVASRQIVQKVLELYETKHYSRPKIDDEIARKWMENVFDQMDSGKFYFLESDLVRFRRMAAEIDDKARLGDIGFMWELLEVLIQRRIQRLAWVDQLADSPLDFTADEDFPIDFRLPSFADDEQAARDIWRRWFKYSVLARRANGDTEIEAIRRTASGLRYQLLNTNQSYDDDGLLEIALSALGEAFDPQNRYMAARTVEDFTIQNQNQLVGIGASLQMQEGVVVVTAVIPGGPVDRDGRLKPGDSITGAGPSASQIQDFAGLQLRDAVSIMRGEENTKITLRVIPKGQHDAVDYDLTRGKVELAGARSNTFTHTRRTDGKGIKIGYVVVPGLYNNWAVRGTDKSKADTRSSTSDLSAILAQLTRENVDVAVLDLRYNTGGPLSEAQEIPGLFIPPGPVLSVQEPGVQPGTYSPQRAKQVWHRPLVVLTGRYTGPGPEIIAGVLQDYRRAIVVGDSRTSANGSAQSVFDIGQELVAGNNPPRLGILRVTTQMFYLPSGRSNHGTGIEANVLLPSFTEATGYTSFQPESLLRAEPVAPLPFSPSAFVNQKLIDELNRYSMQRQEVVPALVAYRDQVGLYGRQQQTPIPLEAKQYFSWHAERIRPKLQYETSGEVVERDAYIDEVLAIALDLAPLGDWQKQYDAGVAELNAGRHASAITHFTSAIDADTRYTEAYHQRANAQAAAGNWTVALADAEQAGLTGLPALATAQAALKVGSDTVATVAAGERLVVTRVNEDWLWAHPAAKPGTSGWLKKSEITLPPQAK